MAYLLVLEGPGFGAVHTLSCDRDNTIGSDPDSTISIEPPTPYPTDARIESDGSDFRLHPVHREIEILVNTEPLGEPRPLAAGDMIRIGDHVFLYGDDPWEAEPGRSRGGISVVQEDLDLSIEGRQGYFENAERLMESLGRTSDPARFLGSFLKVTNTLYQTLDLQELLHRILVIVLEETPADRGTILLHDPHDGALQPFATLHADGSHPDAEMIASRSILREVLENRVGVLTRDARLDDRFRQRLSIHQQSIHSALCVPMVSRNADEVLGLLYVDCTSLRPPFDEDHLKLLTGIAMEAALAIENIQLVEEVAAKRKVEKELEIAREIQTHLLPANPPEIEGLAVAGLMVPATEVGGDYYDFIPSRDGKTLYIALGDVSGKGVPASLVMVMARCFLQPLVDHAASTREILCELNRLLLRDTRPGIFMSFLIVAYDLENQSMTWSAAGQEHLLVRRTSMGQVEAIKAGGVALGIVPETETSYPEHSLPLEPGDVVLLYTDGVTEALDGQERPFGLDATQDGLGRHGGLEVGPMIETLYRDLKTHMGNAPSHDDITMIGIRKC